MIRQCPTANRLVDKHVARLNALITCAVMMTAIISPYHWLAIALAGDLFIRAFVDPRLSITGYPLLMIVRRLYIKPLLANAGPRMFAAKIAFLCATSYALLFVAGKTFAALAFGCALVFCTGLESLFGFCLGCWLYQFVPHLHPWKRKFSLSSTITPSHDRH